MLRPLLHGSILDVPPIHRQSDPLAVEFPCWERIPAGIRPLIESCVRFDNSIYRQCPFTRRGKSIVLRSGDGSESAEEVERTAQRWRQEQLNYAENCPTLVSLVFVYECYGTGDIGGGTVARDQHVTAKHPSRQVR
jgi:hypothetical protein